MKAWNFPDPELKFQKDPLFYAIENDYKKKQCNYYNNFKENNYKFQLYNIKMRILYKMY